MLLSRVAGNLYWAARYLERAEDTARIVREHTNLLVDLPTSVPVTWDPLLAITGSRAGFDGRYDAVDETSIVRYLVADRENQGSILMSVEQARDDLRTCREVVPRELWNVLNDLYLYVASHHSDGVARRSRSRFCERVVAESIRFSGILYATMSRDDAYDFLRLGQAIERADMTTRVIDVRASTLMAGPGDHDDVQWMSVLRSLSALQMYQRTMRRPVDGPSTLRFLLGDPSFPRSVAHCITQVGGYVDLLPRAEQVRPACDAARATVAALPIDSLAGPELHDAMDDVQLAIGTVHERVMATYVLGVAPAA
jgi:uncharacterized alpha-E superfamily protein